MSSDDYAAVISPLGNNVSEPFIQSFSHISKKDTCMMKAVIWFLFVNNRTRKPRIMAMN